MLNSGLLSPRTDLQEQASIAVVVGRLQGAGPPLQEKPEDPLSSPPHQLHQGRLELLQTHYQVSECSIQMLVRVLHSVTISIKKTLKDHSFIQKILTCK